MALGRRASLAILPRPSEMHSPEARAERSASKFQTSPQETRKSLQAGKRHFATGRERQRSRFSYRTDAAETFIAAHPRRP